MYVARLLAIVLIIGLAAHLSACKNEKDKIEKLSVSEVKEMLDKEVPPGSSVSKVIAFLEQHPFEHSEYLEESRTVRAIHRNTVTTPTVTGAVQMVFTFDDNRQLIQSDVKAVYTGP